MSQTILRVQKYLFLFFVFVLLVILCNNNKSFNYVKEHKPIEVVLGERRSSH